MVDTIRYFTVFTHEVKLQFSDGDVKIYYDMSKFVASCLQKHNFCVTNNDNWSKSKNNY